jgi:ribosome-associated protein
LPPRRDSAACDSQARSAVIARKKHVEPASAAPLQPREFALQAARLAADTRCHSVVVLDVTDLSPVTDFFVIATGTSARQMRTVADQIIEMGEKSGYKAYHIDGYDSASWMLVDFVDVVVHIFSEDARHYYDLENLWGDAKKVELNSTPTAS